MALPTKDLDRLKPFKRVSNEGFLVTDKPTDSAVDCGCHTRKDLPDDLDLGLRDYIKRNAVGLGDLLSVIDSVKTITDAIGKTINALQTVINAIPFLRPIAGTALDIIKIFNTIVGVINDALHDFMFEVGAVLVKRAIRLVPQWVPVRKGQLKDGIRSDQIVEVEGIATRSYGNPVEAPFSQWHTWMNWSIQLDPEPQYANLVFADIAPDSGSKAAQGQGTPVAKSGTFDVQWDVGAMNGPQDVSDYRDGFPDTQMPEEDGPMTHESSNWLWPTAGMFVWASGRWVFDCDRVDDVDAAEPATCAIMNPPRAIATAAWGAVEFDQNPLLPNSQLRSTVPAIQFMFFACRRGGYMDYNNDTFTDVDYEFIVDLPPLDVEFPPFPIDFSPNIDHNKIVLRPRLLQKVTPLIRGDSIKIEPVVRVLPAETPGKAPTQALVTIPADVIGRTTKAAGFILSMGWHDPLRLRAAQVKRCSVIMKGVESFIQRDNSAKEFEQRFSKVLKGLRQKIRDRLEDVTILGFSVNKIPTHKTVPRPPVPDFVLTAGDTIHDAIDSAIDQAIAKMQEKLVGLLGGIDSDECLFRVSVNGHWKSVFFRNKNKEFQPFPGSALVFNLDLGPDDPLFIAMGGVEFNGVGAMMRDNLGDRVLKIKSAPISWSDMCFAQNPLLSDIAFQYTVDTLVGNSKRPMAFGSENNAMGLIDPDAAFGTNLNTSNPLILKDIDPVDTSIKRRAKFAHAIAPEFGVYETSDDDYELRYTLSIKDLIRKPQ